MLMTLLLAFVGLDPEWEHMESLGLLPEVVRTTQGVRTPSTMVSLHSDMVTFQRWCVERGTDHHALSPVHFYCS